MAERQPGESKKVLYSLFRHPAFWGISVCGTLFTAVQIAGIANVQVAEWVLFAGWLSLCAEIYLLLSGVSTILRRYGSSLVLLACCVSGFGFLLVGAWIYVTRTEQDFRGFVIGTPPPPSVPSGTLTSYPIFRPSNPKLKSAIPAPAKRGLLLSASLISPNDPALVVENRSDSVAEGVTWELVMYRPSDQAFLSYVTQNVGYIKPHSRSNGYTLQLNTLARAPGGGQLLNGDECIGTLSVDCPLCKSETMVVSFVWGVSGWFYELPPGSPAFFLARERSKDGIAKFAEALNAISKPDGRKPIN